MIPVVISGGSGTRLWPVSRASVPKQFVDFIGESLQKQTLQRVSSLGSPWTVTTSGLKVLTEKTNKSLDIPLDQVVYEPFGRNTAPAVGVICHVLNQKGLGDEVLGIFPADHLVEDVDGFHDAVILAKSCAENGSVVTLGIKPHYAATGYGYIETTNKLVKTSGGFEAYKVQQFCEKPVLAVAQEFIAKGNFFWNAGMFIFRVNVMVELFKKHLPDMWNLLEQIKLDLSNIEDIYQNIKPESIDYGIMEKIDSQVCIPCDIGWSDVGSWDEVARIQEDKKPEAVFEVASENCFVHPHKDRIYGLVGLKDIMVVDTKDAVLVAQKGKSQEIKKLVDEIKEAGSSKAEEHSYDIRPWGSYRILDDTDHYKSKSIVVDPHQQLSYQSHEKREEHWIVVRGQGEVVLNDKTMSVGPGTHIYIPTKAKHRMRNTSDQPLEFVEVQLGSYFGEDDIVRYQDDYNR